MVGPEARPQRLDRYVGMDLGDEYIFYDSAGEQVHILNATARQIYLLCDGERTLQEIAGALASDYEIDESTAFDDTAEILNSLSGLDLVSLS